MVYKNKLKKILFTTYGGTHFKIFNILNKNFNTKFLMVKKFKKSFIKHLNIVKNINIEYAHSKFQLFKKVKHQIKGKDLILGHCPISGTINYIACLFKKKKRVFLMCQDFYEYFNVAEKKSLRKIILGPLFKFCIKLSCRKALVIALSNHIKKKAKTYGAKRIKLIPVYGVDLKNFIPKKSKINFNTNKKIILSTARFAPEKGLPYLLRAISQIDNVLLVLVGAGDQTEIKKCIKKYNIHHKVKIIGEINPIKIVDYYNSCDIFVLPSLKEGLGFASAEAMACKKPVIASNTGGIPDIVIDGYTGLLVEPANVSQLKNSIKKLLYNKELCKKLAQNGYNHVKKNYDEKQVMGDFIQTLSKEINNN